MSSDTGNDRRTMTLGALISPTSAHIAGWRHPDGVSNAGATFEDFRAMATVAEEAKFDFVFIADELSVPDASAQRLSLDPVVYRFEPLTLASALAVSTRDIGIVVTQTTTYNEPYHVARKLASMDHLSGGRIGWNVVTSYVEAEARQFSKSKHADYGDRYRRAAEFLDVSFGLWDSWDEDTFVLERESGRYFSHDEMQRLQHDGEYFSVEGPLNVTRSPQGRPVIVQAGSSEEGLNLAARYAETTFTAQQTLEGAQKYYDDLHRRMLAVGRAPDSLRVVAGFMPIIGGTQEEAARKHAELQELILPEIGLERLSQLIGFDVSGLPLDEPLPTDLPDGGSYQSRRRLIVEMAQRESLTLREIYLRVVASYGHRTVIGTPDTIADAMEEWFLQRGTDGFILSAPVMPTGLEEFAETVVPLLRKRGLVRDEYVGSTLREHLGLPKPVRKHAP